MSKFADFHNISARLDTLEMGTVRLYLAQA